MPAWSEFCWAASAALIESDDADPTGGVMHDCRLCLPNKRDLSQYGSCRHQLSDAFR